MTVHALNLVWKRDGEDVELGMCFSVTRPVAGGLIAFGSDRASGAVWRVVLVYHSPFMERSQTWRDWAERGVEPKDNLTTYWVEPAEGPWEP